MSDTTAQQRGRESRDLGPIGEDTIQLFASQLGLAATKSQRDVEGWDLMSDISEWTTDLWGLPKAPPVICRFQIKATETDRRSVRIGRDNILRMAGQPIPWFVILVRCEDHQAKKIDIIHIGQQTVEAVLKWAITEPDESGFQLPGAGGRIEVEPNARSWFDAIESAIGDKATYIARKTEWNDRAGRPDPAFRFSCAIEHTTDELEDFFLGLRPLISVNSAKISEERFGVQRIHKDIGDAKIEFPNVAPSARVVLTARSTKYLASVECNLYSTHPWLPAATSSKVRLRMSYVDVIMSSKPEQNRVTVVFPDELDLAAAAAEVRFFQVLQNAEDLTFAHPDQTTRIPPPRFTWTQNEIDMFLSVATTHQMMSMLGLRTSRVLSSRLLKYPQLALARVILGYPNAKVHNYSFKDHSTDELPSVVVCSLALSDDNHKAGVVVRLDGSCRVNGEVVFDIAGVRVIDQFAYSIMDASTRLPELLKQHADSIEAAEKTVVDYIV
jgi:hypothetical protein